MVTAVILTRKGTAEFSSNYRRQSAGAKLECFRSSNEQTDKTPLYSEKLESKAKANDKGERPDKVRKVKSAGVKYIRMTRVRRRA